MKQAQSIYGWGTHGVEVRAERGRDKWAIVKGPWPLDDCMDFVVRQMQRQPAAMYRVTEELPRDDKMKEWKR